MVIIIFQITATKFDIINFLNKYIQYLVKGRIYYIYFLIRVGGCIPYITPVDPRMNIYLFQDLTKALVLCMILHLIYSTLYH